MTTFEIVRDAVLLAISVFGAGLSVFNYWEAKQKDRRQIKVVMSTIAPVYGSSIGPAHAKIEATNIGYRDVTVSSLYIELSNGTTLANLDFGFPGLADTHLPMRLTDGETAHRSYSYAGIGEALLSSGRTSKQKIFPVCVDSSGGIYKGEAWDVDPNELARM
ncbi:hypothetical protein U8C36_12200 [Sinorhizobium medicae]|uniref:hypothetical protein n=1 Tax=Sinorhizobium medicae TaxID=110321 RepID=UPI002AF6AC62|nr:hypothetical protein [Sinorhizobium medicae]WQO50723.1 hypothetical protein U8C36_12200 [Sinorhizobium medicae]